MRALAWRVEFVRNASRLARSPVARWFWGKSPKRSTLQPNTSLLSRISVYSQRTQKIHKNYKKFAKTRTNILMLAEGLNIFFMNRMQPNIAKNFTFTQKAQISRNWKISEKVEKSAERWFLRELGRQQLCSHLEMWMKRIWETENPNFEVLSEISSSREPNRKAAEIVPRNTNEYWCPVTVAKRRKDNWTEEEKHGGTSSGYPTYL